MSSQNNMTLEGSSLQNHIVRLCFIFITQKYSHQEQPRFQPSNWFILFNVLQPFSTLTQYMSVSHGYSTMGGIEYNDRDWRRQKMRKSHTDAANQWDREMPIN